MKQNVLFKLGNCWSIQIIKIVEFNDECAASLHRRISLAKKPRNTQRAQMRHMRCVRCNIVIFALVQLLARQRDEFNEERHTNVMFRASSWVQMKNRLAPSESWLIRTDSDRLREKSVCPTHLNSDFNPNVAYHDSMVDHHTASYFGVQSRYRLHPTEILSSWLPYHPVGTTPTFSRLCDDKAHSSWMHNLC